ncbi:MAG: pyridoxamine 5'-phosphate oxidase [Cyanobacteria bacterium P01_H01_bin.105]
MGIEQLRQEYGQWELHREQLPDDPMTLFEQWFQDACNQADLPEPNAMVLGSVSPDGRPTQRTVLLKYFDQNGFVFFTNYSSRKAKHIKQNPVASLLFLWLPLEHQVEIQGRVVQVSTAESLAYFSLRPRGAQLGAWCSQQSQVITSRKLLELKFDEIRRKFANHEIPLPSSWGGYRVIPNRIEFWQGRPNRLHDRFLYNRKSYDFQTDNWQIQRLAP